MTQLAVILVRGWVKLPQSIEDTLNMLKLRRKNACVVVESTPANRGMILKVKDYVTWGEVTPDLFKQLVEKHAQEANRVTDRKKKYEYTVLKIGSKTYKPYFHLHPPRHGFGRKGIKVGFNAGGALGYRAEKINDLIARML